MVLFLLCAGECCIYILRLQREKFQRFRGRSECANSHLVVSIMVPFHRSAMQFCSGLCGICVVCWFP